VTSLDQLQAIFTQRFPLFDTAIGRAVADFGPAWAAECEETLERLFPSEGDLQDLAAGYAHFALDVMRRQRRFEEERSYPAKTYGQAAAEVYHHPGYMTSEYLPGLLLSHYLWPHHYRQAQFFEAAFVAQMPAAEVTSFVEVGIGSGLYSRRILQQLPLVTGVGVDVSASAKAFVESHLRAFGLGDRYGVHLQDVTVIPVAATRWLVCVEVLEHLEDPSAFLDVLRAALEPGGHAFITAALNAPHVDHIYLYAQTAEVTAQLEQAGFVIEKAFEATAHAPREPGLPVPSVAAFVVR
jgi:SAM-dependent methyltransferase